jgi:starch phosphorylase
VNDGDSFVFEVFMPGRPLRLFTVLPHLPERLLPLQKLAYNLWWCWNTDAVALFRRIDVERFESVDHSPVRLLGMTSQTRFEELAKDEGFLAHLDRVDAALENYLSRPTWFQENCGADASLQIAYFSAEFGLHESVPVYSGGLGVLAGDHLKSASDLGVPLCGVSLMYREGYFRQYLNVDGWQQERYPENDFFNLPLIPETRPDGSPLLVSVRLPGREVSAKIWRIQVGRVPLYLIDCNIPQNRPEDRAITSQLYGGDSNTRIQQEIVLGIGGLRALRLLGKEPTVCHMNEGHSAFCSLERMRVLIQEQKYEYTTALEAVKAGTCFTTHTPVPAGNDAFPPHMMDEYFNEFRESLGIDRNTFMNLGREHPNHEGESFSMTVLAIHTSNTSNGVSKLHGEVSRKMWKRLWPGLPESEVPIGAITNGVHAPTWVSPEMGHLFDRYLGHEWVEKPLNLEVWKRVDGIPDAEIWRNHERCREKLVVMARHRLKAQLKKRGAPPSQIEAAEEVLDPDALTIGFARRFATYKRGTLIFRNAERLAAILNDPKRPVQLIFSGKAHPKDFPGKEFIAQVVQLARRPEFNRRIVFIEDYEMNVARTMVQGVDVWLNNPRRPLEASGTSGMKVCCNGGLNLSVLDGWWVEGYLGDNGFAIGAGEDYHDQLKEYQDDVESRAIYELIEQEIVPSFYTRGNDGLPRSWIRRMKRSISTNVSVFNTSRMVQEYTEWAYLPAYHRHVKLVANALKGAKELAQWRSRLLHHWGEVKVLGIESTAIDPLKVGQEFPVSVQVALGALSPQDVEVQLCHGLIDSMGEIAEPKSTTLSTNGKQDGNHWTYQGKITCASTGQFGFSVRVLPKHESLNHSFEPGLVTWG